MSIMNPVQIAAGITMKIHLNEEHEALANCNSNGDEKLQLRANGSQNEDEETLQIAAEMSMKSGKPAQTPAKMKMNSMKPLQKSNNTNKKRDACANGNQNQY